MNIPVANTVLDAALSYAAAGWQVFPCHPNDKHPMLPKETSPGARDGGLWLATTDEGTLRGWWRTRAGAMIGVRMGTGCGAFALDFDPFTDPETGEITSFEDLLAQVEGIIGERLPPTLTSETPRGGRHMLFQPPEGVGLEEIGNSRGVLPRHVDVRGNGGYIILAPSVRRGPKAVADGCDGVAYRWVDAKASLATAPVALIDALLRRGRFAAVAAHASATPPQRQTVDGSDEDAAVRRYALAALDNACGRVRQAGKGDRNQTLNNEALGIGHLVGAGALDRSTAYGALFTAAASWGIPANDKALKPGGTLDRALDTGAGDPFDTSEIRRTARDRAARRGASLRHLGTPGRSWPAGYDEAVPPADRDPRDDVGAPAPSSPAPTPEVPHESPDLGEAPELGGRRGNGLEGGTGDVNLRCAFYPMTDLGNAARFLDRYGADFLFVREWGFLAWDGRRWARDGAEDRLERAIQSAIRAIVDEADTLRKSPDDVAVGERKKQVVRASDELAEWALTSQGAAHINCLKGLLQADLARRVADFDADPWRLNVLNGTLDIARRGDDEPYVVLRPHRREDKITKLAPVIYDPKARCPRFDQFMVEVQPDAGVRRVLDQWGGVNLVGDASMQRLFFLYGKGRNGKSVWMDTVAFVAGEYSESIPIETFIDQGRARNAGAPTPELAILSGVRCLRTSEPERGAKLAESLIKLATGGEPMKVRELNKGYFTLRVEFKLTMQGNYRPKIDGVDEGIWGRLELVPWPVFIPPEKRDPTLTLKLRAESSGILNRLLAGLCDYLDNGLVRPDVVRAATEEYRADSDPLGRFLSVCTRPALGKRVQSTEMHALYLAWAKVNGGPLWTLNGLGRALRDRGIPDKKSSVVYWLDVELIMRPMDFDSYTVAAHEGAAEEHVD